MDHHDALNQINANCEAQISKEPHRTKYFLALKELNIQDKQSQTLDRIHEAMHKRVIEQVRSGALKI